MEKALTITQLNEHINSLLTKDPLLYNLRVQGEVSGFKKHISGHLYFSLKDDNAIIRCVMFKSAAHTLRFVPKDGAHIIAEGYVALYQRDGQVQLYVLSMQKEGEGELFKRYLLLKAKLEDMGYFAQERKRAIPFLPKCIGIVTSSSGAALQDILQIIRRRYPIMDVQLYPVQVQGDLAAKSIADGIKKMNEISSASVLIVGRGGGSIEDLWAFNEPEVASAIFESRIPVISAVGHETDFTIADFVSDLRASTPSAAAELCTPEYSSLVLQTDSLLERLSGTPKRTLQNKKDRLKMLMHARGLSIVGYSLNENKRSLDNSMQKLHHAVLTQLKMHHANLDSLLKRHTALSLSSILDRGFALIYDENGKLLSSVSGLINEMEVKIQMRDGYAAVRIKHNNCLKRSTNETD